MKFRPALERFSSAWKIAWEELIGKISKGEAIWSSWHNANPIGDQYSTVFGTDITKASCHNPIWLWSEWEILINSTCLELWIEAVDGAANLSHRRGDDQVVLFWLFLGEDNFFWVLNTFRKNLDIRKIRFSGVRWWRKSECRVTPRSREK